MAAYSDESSGGGAVGSALSGATPERFVTVDASGNIQTHAHSRYVGNQAVFGNAAPQSGYKVTIHQDDNDLGFIVKTIAADNADSAVGTWMNAASQFAQVFVQGSASPSTRVGGLANASLFRLAPQNLNAALIGAEDAPNYMPYAAAEYFTPGGRIFQFFADVATGANTTETDANSVSIKANTLTRNGDIVWRRDVFFLAANANTKRIRTYWGATTVFDSTAVADNGGAVVVDTYVQRTGAATQRCWAVVVANGTGTPIDDAAARANATETLSGAVTFKATMTNGTASAGDITCYTTNVYADPAGH